MTGVVTKAAAVNEGGGKETMAMLLDKRGENIQITEEIVKAAAANFPVLNLMLNTRGGETVASITQQTCFLSTSYRDLA
ncbi:hypothetical protein LY76DRAFT_672636 [Colletotrichum caudatum]|nr:hypothetical protein LY76DRAFT_672636 [Colletotrichum caudatum]